MHEIYMQEILFGRFWGAEYHMGRMFVDYCDGICCADVPHVCRSDGCGVECLTCV